MSSEIPFFFLAPTPTYFKDNGWFKNPKNRLFVTWCFERCSQVERSIVFDGQLITLKPYQFIFGRMMCVEELGLTEDEVRTQQKRWENAGFLKKAPNKTPNRFTLYEWVLTHFLKANPQQNPQQTPNKPPTNPHNLANKNISFKDDKEKNTKKEIALEKVKVREFVTLTQQELDVLTQLHSSELCNMMFDELNAYKGSSGKSYKSDYHTMSGRGWVLKKCLAERDNPTHAQPGATIAKKRPVEVNRQLATQAAKQYKSQTCELNVNGKEVTFIPLIGQQGPQSLSFFHDDFADELKLKLDKFSFRGAV